MISTLAFHIFSRITINYLFTPFNHSAVLLMQTRRGYFRLQYSRLCAAKKIPWHQGSVEENNEEEVQRVRTHLLPTDYCQIPRNALCLSRKFCIRYCFHILLGISVLPRGFEKNSVRKIWGGGGKQSAIDT